MVEDRTRFHGANDVKFHQAVDIKYVVLWEIVQTNTKLSYSYIKPVLIFVNFLENIIHVSG